MLYGIDTPLALALLVIWTTAGVRAARLLDPMDRRRRSGVLLGLVCAALVVVVGHAVAVLLDLSWFLTPALTWLHLVLTLVPAVLVAGLTLPRLLSLRRTPDEAGAGERADLPKLVVPVQTAALAAAVNLFFLLAPLPEPRVVDVATPLVLLAGWAALSTHRWSRRARGQDRGGRRSALGRVAVSVGTVLAVVAGWAAIGIATAPESAGPAPTPTHPVRTGTVTTEGDDLHYEVRGDGPPLVMISGGGGDADFYAYVADILADDHQVITYDRRGNSRSTHHPPQNFDVAQQARDVVAVITATGHETADVFGNSGGAVIALELAAAHPDRVRTVVAHEPPTVRVLPDREKWLAFFASVYRTSYTLGPEVANFAFSMSLKAIPISAFGTTPEGFGERMAENTSVLMRQEMVPAVTYRPDTARIAANGTDVIPAAGALTLATGDYYGRTAPILAAELGREAAVFPGHHLSYFDRPETWAATLDDLLQQR